MRYAKWSSTLGSALCLLMACSSAYTPRILAQVDAGLDPVKSGKQKKRQRKTLCLHGAQKTRYSFFASASAATDTTFLPL